MNGYIKVRKMKCGKRGEKNNGEKRRIEIWHKEIRIRKVKKETWGIKEGKIQKKSLQELGCIFLLF